MASPEREQRRRRSARRFLHYRERSVPPPPWSLALFCSLLTPYSLVLCSVIIYAYFFGFASRGVLDLLSRCTAYLYSLRYTVCVGSFFRSRSRVAVRLYGYATRLSTRLRSSVSCLLTPLGLATRPRGPAASPRALASLSLRGPRDWTPAAVSAHAQRIANFTKNAWDRHTPMRRVYLYAARLDAHGDAAHEYEYATCGTRDSVLWRLTTAEHASPARGLHARS